MARISTKFVPTNFQQMNVLGIIPARYDSSRFPGKPLIDINGKTMIQRVYEGVQKSTKFSDIIVATDDQRILAAVQSFGGKAMMTSTEHTTGTDRCGEIAEKIADADVIVNIQGDEPLVDYRQLDELIAVFENDETKIATLGIQISDREDLSNPNRIKMVLNHHDEAIYFSRSAIPNQHHAREENLDNFVFLRHIGVYAFQKEVLLKLIKLKPTQLEKIESLEQLRWMYYGYPIKVVKTTIETPNIDVPEDLEVVLKALS